MVGTMDPLRDIAYLFLQKWVKADVDVKLVEFAHLPHGFLNYGIPVVGMNEVTEWINKVTLLHNYIGNWVDIWSMQ